MTIVSCAVEGDLDEAVLRRLLGSVALDCGPVYGLMGKEYLERRIDSYAAAARRAPWVVLVDLDDDSCAAGLVAAWLPSPPSLMRLRVAVREVEAWLLADRRTLARFLSVSRDLIPRAPEAVEDPKRTLVDLARRSRSRSIRDGMAPRPDSGRSISPLYVAELSRFVREHWDIDAVTHCSDSLTRCVRALRSLAKT